MGRRKLAIYALVLMGPGGATLGQTEYSAYGDECQEIVLEGWWWGPEVTGGPEDSRAAALGACEEEWCDSDCISPGEPKKFVAAETVLASSSGVGKRCHAARVRLTSVAVAAGALIGCGQVEASAELQAADTLLATVGPPLFSVSSNEDVTFHMVVETAAFMDGGGVMVGNRGDNELVWLNESGQVVRKSGRTGEGPGEFTFLMSLWSDGRDVYTTDLRLPFVSVFGEDGAHLRSIPARLRAGSELFGALPDGRIVVGPPFRRDGEPEHPYLILDQAGKQVSSFAGPQYLPRSAVTVRTPISTMGLGGTCLPDVTGTVVGSSIFLVDGSGTVLVAAPDGRHRMLYQARRPPLVTPRIEQKLAGFLLNSDTLESVMRRLGPIGSRLPATWTQVIPDLTGRLWLELADCYSTSSSTYEVIDTAGSFVAWFHGPPSSRVLAASRDRVLIVRFDDFGAEHIELYRIGPPR